MKSFQPRPASGAPPYVIAHRGISARAPENTMAAFLRAAEAPGIDMIELDVRLSRDEEVIVLHDRNLQRTTTGNGAARNYRLDEIRAFDAGSWFHPSFASERVPTLRNVLSTVGSRLWVNIEIKSDWLHREPPGLLEERVLDTVRSTGMIDRVMVSSFDHLLVREIKRREPALVAGLLYNLYRDFGRLPSTLARGTDASVFVCARHELRRSWIDDAHRHGMAVFVYTLNSAPHVRRMISLGVDGVLSNAADELADIVRHEHRKEVGR